MIDDILEGLTPVWHEVGAEGLAAAAVVLIYGINHGAKFLTGKFVKQSAVGADAIRSMALDGKNYGKTNSPDLPFLGSAPVRPLPPGAQPVALCGYTRASDGSGTFVLTDGSTLVNPAATFDGRTLRLNTGQVFSFRPRPSL